MLKTKNLKKVQTHPHSVALYINRWDLLLSFDILLMSADVSISIVVGCSNRREIYCTYMHYMIEYKTLSSLYSLFQYDVLLPSFEICR